MLCARTKWAISFSVIGCAFPSMRKTSCSGGVRLLSKNIQRCGMKLRVTPLSGLYSRMFIEFVPCAEGLCTGRAEHLVVIQEMLPGCINPVSLDLYNSTPQLNETEKISRV